MSENESETKEQNTPGAAPATPETSGVDGIPGDHNIEELKAVQSQMLEQLEQINKQITTTAPAESAGNSSDYFKDKLKEVTSKYGCNKE